ncbi:MAG: ABC transporter substrate-binding protein [Alphaproteobacteria bacterium]|nr:ABC transporter substrate-binding protein [Alphaproteobacteria bacterium]
MRRWPPWILAAFAALALVWAIASFVGPAPPKRVVIAGGAPGGGYAAAAEELAQGLREVGVEVEIIATAGSAENLARLAAADDTRVDVALVQSGLSREVEGVQALGALFSEPIWIFARRTADGPDMQALEGLAVAAGPPGSGARSLAETLLADNGLGAGDLTLEPIGGRDAVAAVRAGRVDAAFVVASPQAGWVQEFTADPTLALIPFDRAPAYERRAPYLSAVTLRRGVLDPAADRPRQDVPLLAASAQLAVRSELHPAIQSVLLQTAEERFSRGDVLSAPGTYPNPHGVDLPLSEEAVRFHQTGPSTLRRYLPYWAANLVERAGIVIIPALLLLSPLIRSAPPVYRWRIRRRVYLWYRDLKDLEGRARAAKTDMDIAHVRAGFAALQQEVGRIAVPESYTDELYRLREHIAFVEAQTLGAKS